MATNNFKPFATGTGANVTAQAEYEALTALLTGFASGKASSAQVNKALRQSTFVAAALAQFIQNKSAIDVLDDGDLAGFVTDLGNALNKHSQPLDAGLTSLAALVGGANKLPYYTAADVFAQTDISAIGRALIGQSSIANVLTYLGLGDGSALPVGVPVPWPTSTAPTGWLKCNGAAFTAATYPKLALAYPALVLPDLRGEFIRGWDDGRGVDSGRTLLSAQGGTYVSFDPVAADSAPVFSPAAATASDLNGDIPAAAASALTYQFGTLTITKYSPYPTGALAITRPRNIALNYIVRAA